MIFKPPQLARTNRVVTKRQEFNTTYTVPTTNCENNFYNFSPQTHSLPYHYGLPYNYAYPYTYFANPYYPPYSYIPQQYEDARVNPVSQNMGSRQEESENIEEPHQVQIKIEHEQQPKTEEKPAEKMIFLNKKKRETSPKPFDRKHYRTKESLMNSQINLIFNRVIRTYISQEPNLSKQKAEIKRLLKQKQELEGCETFYEQLFQTLKKKFADFRKTKEQMIKYIIRRTYHNYKMSKGGEYRPETDRLELFHQRNLSLHKSMNSDFLRKQFSNKLFVEIYKEFLDQMDQQFEKQNEDRVQKLSLILTSSWADKNLKVLLQEKKLPWNMNYKRKVRQIAYNLLKQFYPQDSESKEEPFIKNIQEPEIK